MITSDLTTKEQQFLASLKVLDEKFYTRKDVIKIAKELLGKIIVTHFDEQLTAARITETEAYNGIVDKASHAYNDKTYGSYVWRWWCRLRIFMLWYTSSF